MPKNRVGEYTGSKAYEEAQGGFRWVPGKGLVPYLGENPDPNPPGFGLGGILGGEEGPAGASAPRAAEAAAGAARAAEAAAPEVVEAGTARVAPEISIKLLKSWKLGKWGKWGTRIGGGIAGVMILADLLDSLYGATVGQDKAATERGLQSEMLGRMLGNQRLDMLQAGHENTVLSRIAADRAISDQVQGGYDENTQYQLADLIRGRERALAQAAQHDQPGVLDMLGMR